MSIIIKVSVVEIDFLKGYLEQQLDPVYHILANMHDLCLSDDLNIPQKENIKIQCKKLLDSIVYDRTRAPECEVTNE